MRYGKRFSRQRHDDAVVKQRARIRINAFHVPFCTSFSAIAG
jgi:hypothetical protein